MEKLNNEERIKGFETKPDEEFEYRFKEGKRPEQVNFGRRGGPGRGMGQAIE